MQTQEKYRVFKRSCKSWSEFSAKRKITVRRGLTWSAARAMCSKFNDNRNASQIKKCTMMEFEAE